MKIDNKISDEEKALFPADILPDLEKGQSLDQSREATDLSDKEIELFIRLFPFTPNSELQKKFGIEEKTIYEILNTLKKEGIPLKKDPLYSKTLVNRKSTAATRSGQDTTPGYIVSALMNAISEEERREILLFYEEGVDPIPLMRQLIVLQSARVIRGFKQEQANANKVQKPVNDAANDLRAMINDLHNMTEGQKHVLSVDDRFAALVQKNQMSEEEYEG